MRCRFSFHGNKLYRLLAIVVLCLLLLGVGDLFAEYQSFHWFKFIAMASLCLGIALYIDVRAAKQNAHSVDVDLSDAKVVVAKK
ncbi:MAG: hypothetical protein KTR20_15265 [Cellvibrionaceae bacterium]|nr:hypothetical protein [Cellvibrionaceae bacterium]